MARRGPPPLIVIPMRAHSKLSIITLGVTLALSAARPLAAQSAQFPPLPGQQQTGPLIESTGASFKVDNPTFEVPAGHVFKALWIISAGGGDSVKVNQQLVTIARFYNVHARNGYPEDHLKAAAVFHGDGWPALLTDAAFVARFGGKGNPSKKLVEELLQHGAQLVLCGQTAGARGVHREELLPGVKVATSAMTAFNVLQSQGYLYNPW
jgi:intracellular sulfur oxidation DsrE/DsrF family protein